METDIAAKKTRNSTMGKFLLVYETPLLVYETPPPPHAKRDCTTGLALHIIVYNISGTDKGAEMSEG